MKPRAPPIDWMFSIESLDDVVNGQGYDRKVVAPRLERRHRDEKPRKSGGGPAGKKRNGEKKYCAGR